jgi:hypothetical protein
MAGKSIVQDAAEQLTGKAIMWGPAIAGAALLGTPGGVLGLAASAAIAAKVISSSPRGDGQGSRGRNVPPE